MEKCFFVHLLLSIRSGANANLIIMTLEHPNFGGCFSQDCLYLAYGVSVQRSHLCPSLKGCTFSFVITKEFHVKHLENWLMNLESILYL
jgi:hypothetical protein